MAKLRATAGRIILKFPRPAEQAGSIIIPETSRMRPEFGEIYDVGPALNDDQLEWARYFRELKDYGVLVAMSYGSGVTYWKENYDPKEWGWLRDYRAYRFEEPAAYLAPDEAEDDLVDVDEYGFLVDEKAVPV